MQAAIATEATKLALSNAGVSMSMSDVNFANVGKDNDTAADMRENKPRLDTMTLATYGLAAAGIGFAIFECIFAKLFVTYIAMAICIGNAIFTVIQRRALSKLDTLRQVHNELRNEIGKLKTQNDVLSKTNDELHTQVDHLHEVEQGLQDVVTQQGQTVDLFVSVVKDNRIVLDKIKENLESQVLTDLIKIVMSADNDQDFTVDPEEVDGLVGRMHLVSGIILNEQKFRAMLASKGFTLGAVLDICRELLGGDSDVPEEDRVIRVSMDGMSADDF